MIGQILWAGCRKMIVPPKRTCKSVAESDGFFIQALYKRFIYIKKEAHPRFGKRGWAYNILVHHFGQALALGEQVPHAIHVVLLATLRCFVVFADPLDLPTATIGQDVLGE